MSVGALAKMKEKFTMKAREVADIRASAPGKAATTAAVFTAGATAAGVLDGLVVGATDEDDDFSIPPSALAGVAGFLGGLFMKAPSVITASAGAVAPFAYRLSRNMTANAMSGDGEPAEETPAK